MQLSSESFRELASNLTGQSVPSDGQERRRSGRVKIQSRVPLSLFSKGEQQAAVPIMVSDISPRGINVLYPEALKQGQQFTVQLSGGAQRIIMLCTVMHTRQAANGLHSVGAEFTCVLPSPGTKAPTDEKTLRRIRESVLD